MTRRILGIGAVLAFWLGGHRGMLEASVETISLSVEPLARYRLSFVAEVAQAGYWELRIRTSEGLLPYEGVWAEDWQKIQSGKHAYRHDFLTPRDGRLLELVVKSSGNASQLEDVILEKISDENLLINGDLAAGIGNYSGWNTTFLAQLKEDENGRPVLSCEKEGYIVSDPIPVQPGGTYRFLEGTSPGGRILIYDRDLLGVGMLFEGEISPHGDSQMVMPSDAAFIRIEYGDRRDARSPAINFVGVELVSKGPPMAVEELPPYPGEIILPPKAALPEVRAARELQYWIREISGREIRVLAEHSHGDKDGWTRIFVGQELAKKDYADDLKALEGSDGFALRKKNRNVYVFGAQPAGSLFGAIRLLEDNSDIIFARPNREYGTVFTRDPDLRFEHADRLLRPAFPYRMSHAYSADTYEDGIWQGRAGLNTSPRVYNNFRRRAMGGTSSFESNYMGTIAQRAEYAFEKCAKEHPEFFALVDGNRQIMRNGYICYTAPGIVKALADGIREVIESYADHGETLEFIQIRTRDGWTVCTCETCMEPIVLADGSRLAPKSLSSEKDPLFFSTRMTQMLNQVSEDLARTNPGVTLTVPGYLYASSPPAIPHDPSLAPIFCAYDLCSIRFPILDGKNNHFSDGRKWEEKFREYLKRTAGGKKLSMFSYHYAKGFSAVADSAREDWLEMVKTGGAYQIHLDGFMRDTPDESGISAWDYAAPEQWIISRLLWDPALDPQKLREEYCRRVYQDAAPEMIEFHNLIRAAWEDPKIEMGVNCHSSGRSLFETFITKAGNEEKLRALLVQAGKKAKLPMAKKSIARVIAAFDHFADSLQRTYIPFVAEAKSEWSLPESTFWLQALIYRGFKKASTSMDFRGAPATRPTTVAIMRDGENLYLRFEAEEAGDSDRVEVVLRAARNSIQYYLALDRKAQVFEMRNSLDWHSSEWVGKVVATDKGYIAMFRIPFSLMENLDVSLHEFQFLAKFARFASGGHGMEESSLTGFAVTRTHYNNYWTTLSVKKAK